MIDQFDDKSFIRVGTITGTHGLNGRLKVRLYTDVMDRFNEDQSVYIKAPDGYYDVYQVEGFSVLQKKRSTLNLNKIKTYEDAKELKGRDIFISLKDSEVSRNDILDEDSLYYYDLIECVVIHEDEEYGTVVDIMEAGAGEVLVIKSNSGKEVMIPFVKSMVDISKVKEKKLIITPVEGLLDS